MNILEDKGRLLSVPFFFPDVSVDFMYPGFRDCYKDDFFLTNTSTLGHSKGTMWFMFLYSLPNGHWTPVSHSAQNRNGIPLGG